MAKRESAPASHNEDANIITSKGVYGLKYSNGDQHWYLENPGGRNAHISEDAMLKKHGYGPKDFPDRELTVAMPEDYDVAVEEPKTPGKPKPGEIGGVISPPVSLETPATIIDPEPALDPVDTTTEIDNDKEAEEFIRGEKAKEALVARLQENIGFMTDAAVAFEKTGDMEKRDKAFYKFVEMFDTLADLQGWDKAKRDGYMDTWVIIVTGMLTPKMETDPVPTPDADKAAKAVADSESLSRLSGLLAASRRRLAELNVKASGRIRVGRKLNAELEKARDEWEALQVEVGARTMEQIMLNDAGITQEQMRVLASQGALNEGAALSQAQLAAMEAGPDGGRFKKYWHKYVQKYNRSGKLMKAVMLAPAGFVIGTGIGTIFGAIGGGIAAGLVARGAVKGALTAKMQALNAQGGKQVDVGSFNISLDEEDEARAPHLLALQAACLNRSATETEVDKDTRQNKKRAGKAILIGGIIGAASGIAANLFTNQHPVRGSGLVGKKTGWDPFDGQDHPTGSAPELAPTPGVPSPEDFADLYGIDLDGPRTWPFKVTNALPGIDNIDSIRLAEQNGFTFEAGKYWIDGRMMNPAEMSVHNHALAALAASRTGPTLTM